MFDQKNVHLAMHVATAMWAACDMLSQMLTCIAFMLLNMFSFSQTILLSVIPV